MKRHTRLNFPLATARHLFFAPLCVFSFGKLAIADVENPRKNWNMVKVSSTTSRAFISCNLVVDHHMADPQDDADRVRCDVLDF